MIIDPNLKLSPHFYLREFTRSKKADELGIDNVPKTIEIVENLRGLCINTLEPLRFFLGKPIDISSGYRCPALNLATGGSLTSEHMAVKGAAADIEVAGVDNCELAHVIKDGGFVFDQLILEFYKAPVPDSGWCHTGWRREPRFQVMTARKNDAGKVVYVNGLPPFVKRA